MLIARFFSRALLIIAVVGVTASAHGADLPAAPAFDGWTVKSDNVVPAKDIAPIAKRLGANITALRNTVYDVAGKRIQINVIVVADASDGDKVVASLTQMKPAWSVLRRGTTIYEFVGQNDAIDLMKKAREQLASR
jgi:hypothetical protein